MSAIIRHKPRCAGQAKFFDAIVRPVLYSQVHFAPSSRIKNRFFSFFETIFRRPELGACVSRLGDDDVPLITAPHVSKDQAKIFEGIGEHLDIEVCQFLDAPFYHWCYGVDLLLLALPLMPNLRELHMTASAAHISDVVHLSLRRHIRLLRLELIDIDWSRADYDAVDFEEDRCYHFLLSATNLKELRLRGCDTFMADAVFLSLRKIDFVGVLEINALKTLVRCAPRLERFKYISAATPALVDQEFTPAEATKCLSRCKTTLVSIRIEQILPGIRRYAPGTEWNGGAGCYSNFPCLEELILDPRSILPQQTDDMSEEDLEDVFGNPFDWSSGQGQETEEERANRYVDLLPASIRVFGVSELSPPQTALVLAKAVAEGRFPKLEQVTIATSCNEDQEDEEMIKAFEAAGVTYTHASKWAAHSS